MSFLGEFAYNLFFDTPLPLLFVLYVFYYRHDLGKMRKPFREDSSKRNWWRVCIYLGLIPPDTPKPGRLEGRRGYIVSLAIASVVSLLSFLKPIQQSVIWLIVVQGVSSIILFGGVVARRLGPRPPRPYADALRYPRLGSRVKHLIDLEGRPHPQFEPQQEPTGAAGDET